MSRFNSTNRWAIGLLLAPLALTISSCTDEPLPTGALRQAEGPALTVEASRAMKISAGVAFVDEVVPPPAPCLQLFSSTIEGNATHLGRFEGVGSTCILDVVAPDPDPPFLAPGPPPYITASFSNPRWELTAADGDELWLEGHSAVCVISLSDNSLRCVGAHTIIGGTGRFAGATGELDSGAVNEDGQGPDDFESRGWIRF